MPRIITTGITRDGFVLPHAHSWDAIIFNGRKQGKVTVRDENDDVSHVLHFKNDQLYGVSEYYSNGKLVEKLVWKNNILVKKLVDDTTMVEYDKEENKVYKGGYLDVAAKDYPREGTGKEYDDGMVVYSGEWKNGKREGKGKEFDDGEVVYEGEWKNGLPDGFGCMRVEGKMYRGTWINGRINFKDNLWFDYSTRKIERSCRYSDEESEKKGTGLAAATVATGITGYATSATGALASLVGFGSPGVAAGSWAASMMSASATSGIGAGLISALQSAGALFVNAAGGSVLVASSAVALPVVAGVVTYNVIKKAKSKDSKRKRR